MTIICNKYIYNNSVDYSEVNYFSETAEETREELDLSDYLIKDGISEISITKKEIDENNSIYIEAGNVTLSLTNTLQGYGDVNDYLSLNEAMLTDFFDYYETGKAIFKIDIKDDNSNILFTGIIRKKDISFDERTSEVMTIIVRSIDKEFSDYYSTQRLVSFPEIPNYQFQNISYDGLYFAYATDVLTRNFPKVTFSFQSDLTHFLYEYIISGKPYIYYPCNHIPLGTGQTLILKSGYDPCYYDQCSVYVYFNSLLISMGWKWYFKNGECYVEKLADASKDINSIDYADVITHSVSNELKTPIYNVAIDNGEWYGNIADEIQEESRVMNLVADDGLYYYLGGRSIIIHSESETYNNNERPFNRFDFFLGITTAYLRVFYGWTFSTEKTDDASNDFLRMRTYFNIDHGWTFQFQVNNYLLDNTLRINPFIPSPNNSAVLDLNYPRTTNSVFYGNGNAHIALTGQPPFDSSNSGIYYRGNPGSSMLKYDSGSGTYTPYDFYVRTDEFKNNMKTYLTKQEQESDRINLTVNGIINDYDKNYEIVNYPYANYQSKIFTYEDVSFDLINNVTNLKLISIN